MGLSIPEFRRVALPARMQILVWKGRKCIILHKKKGNARPSAIREPKQVRCVVFISDRLWKRIHSERKRSTLRERKEQRIALLAYYLECVKRRGGYRWEPISYRM